MGKSNFGAVDSAIAGSFEQSEIVGVVRVKDQTIKRLLTVWSASQRNKD